MNPDIKETGRYPWQHCSQLEHVTVLEKYADDVIVIYEATYSMGETKVITKQSFFLLGRIIVIIYIAHIYYSQVTLFVNFYLCRINVPCLIFTLFK